jgi:hypothetical protein
MANNTEDSEMTHQPLHVLVTAGHRNAHGGNADEARETGERVNAILDLHKELGGAAKLGFTIRTTTPEEGLGWSSEGLDAVFLDGFNDGTIPDFSTELHSDIRQGSHMVYPNMGGDLDIDVQRHGRIFCDDLKKHTGMPVWEGVNGLLPESQTHVGSGGHRLGIFAVTRPYAEKTTRCLFEQGAHSGPYAEILFQPDFPEKAARAFLESLPKFFEKVDPSWNDSDVVNRYPLPKIPQRAMKVGMVWSTLVKQGFEEEEQLLGVKWRFKRQILRAKRRVPAWTSPSFKENTRKPIEVGERVTFVLEGKAPDDSSRYSGKRLLVSEYGSIVVASAFG